MLKKKNMLEKILNQKLEEIKPLDVESMRAGGRTLEDGCKATAQSGKAGRGSDPNGGYPGRCGFYNEEKRVW